MYTPDGGARVRRLTAQYMRTGRDGCGNVQVHRDSSTAQHGPRRLLQPLSSVAGILVDLQQFFAQLRESAHDALETAFHPTQAREKKPKNQNQSINRSTH